MTSRRQFIQKAGLLGAMGALPGLADAHPAVSDSLTSETRRQLLIPPDKIYLNTGSLGPSPQPVIDAVVGAMRKLEGDPVTENWGSLGEEMEKVRSKIAQFIHADKTEILLTRNTTEGLNLIAECLEIQKGDEIITTTLEHGGGEVGLEYMVEKRGAKLKKIELPLPPDDETAVLDVIESNLSSRTRLVMLSHINTITGMVMPLDKVSALLKPRGIILVADGAQAPGQVPMDVKAMGVHAYATSGHKWLLGPKETGFVYFDKSFQERIHPVFSFSGFESYTKSSGTRNVATIIGLGAALDWHTAIGVDKIRSYTLELKNYCQRKLKELPGIKVLSPEKDALSSAMTSFSLDKLTNHEVYEKLKKSGIIVKVLPAHNAIRISCHVFVSKDDIDKFINALKPLLS